MGVCEINLAGLMGVEEIWGRDEGGGGCDHGILFP